jgi:hypothetical protein
MRRYSYYQTTPQLPSPAPSPGFMTCRPVSGALGSWRCDMRVSKSAVQKSAFPGGTATREGADLKHHAPVGPRARGDIVPCRVGTQSFPARRCDWSPRPTSTVPPLPAGDELPSIGDGTISPAPYPSSAHSGRTAIAAHRAFNSKVRAGWSNEGREVFAAWILALLGIALAVLLLACHQPSTSDLRLLQWSDPPVGAESWADDLMPGRDENLVSALGNITAPGPLRQQ